MEYLGVRTTGIRLWQRKGRAHLTKIAFRSVSIRKSTTEHGNSIELFVKTRFHFQLGKCHTNWKGLRKIKKSRMMERLNFNGGKNP